MRRIYISEEAARFLAEILTSCGNNRCEPVLNSLFKQREAVFLDSFWRDGAWEKPVFGNLQHFAIDEKIKELGINEVICYFGGKHHIAHMIRKAARSNLSYLMGTEAGLVLDVLLPLKGSLYSNAGYRLEFSNLVDNSSTEKGTRFVHRGLVVRAKVSKRTIERILAEQVSSPEFTKALNGLGKKIEFPENFIKALEENRIGRG